MKRELAKKKCEKERLKALKSFRVLDTPREEDIDQLTALAASICDAPMAAVNFVDEKRQWVKAAFGAQAGECPRELAFCDFTILGTETVVISDLSVHERFKDHPLVTREKGLRFYAGAPLVTSQGHSIGAVCVLDYKSKEMQPHQIRSLELLAKQVMKHLELGMTRRQLALQRSQLNETRDRLTEATNFLLKIMNNVPVALTCKNIQSGRYNLWNKEASDIWGISRERAIGKSDRQLFDDERAALIAAKEAEAVEKEHIVELEEEYISSVTGQTKVLLTRYLPILVSRGKPKFVMTIAEDITEKKSTQMQLLHSARMSSLGRMAAGISHEINNPLAVIRGKAYQLTGLLNRSAPVTELFPMVAKIDEMAVRISKIVSGLRVFARDGSHEPFRLTTMNDLVNTASELCSSQFISRNVRLDAPKENTDLQVECGNIQITQVLVNLLNNAIDAVSNTSEPLVKIEILDRGKDVEVAVLDNGPGVPKESRQEIMQPFFTTKEIGKGTGLGLSISKGIMESHGGTLWLDESSPLTRFALRFPKRKKQEENLAAAA